MAKQHVSSLFCVIFAACILKCFTPFCHCFNSSHPNLSTPNFRQGRFLDFYTCTSSYGTMGICMPQPYCSSMVPGGIVDSHPRRACSNLYLKEYGCCTLLCGGTSAADVENHPTSKQQPISANEQQQQEMTISVQSNDEQKPANSESAATTALTTVTPTEDTTTFQPVSSTTFVTDLTPIRTPNFAFSNKCGKLGKYFNPLEVKENDGLATPGKWCWQAAIFKSADMSFLCGGVLLDDFHVLTVAHCVDGEFKTSPWKLNVRLGDTNLRSTEDDYVGIRDVGVTDVVLHGKFTGVGPFEHDVAVLRLKTAARAPDSVVCHVCMPSPKQDNGLPSLVRRPKEGCVATGYGKRNSHDSVPLMRLKEVPVPLIPHKPCEQVLKSLLGKSFSLPETFLCAGANGGADACEYDGGGPLVCPTQEGEWFLKGIVTWGLDCGARGVPGIYTDVLRYNPWIFSTIAKLNHLHRDGNGNRSQRETNEENFDLGLNSSRISISTAKTPQKR